MKPVPSISAINRVPGRAKHPAVGWTLRLVGLGILTAGAVWALVSLELSWQEISPELFLLSFLILTPVQLALGAISLQINAWSLGYTLTPRGSLQVVSFANLAELLPLPAGAVVRGAALIEVGASLAESTRITLLTSLLTIFMTLSLSLLALAALANTAWIWLSLLSAIGIAVICFLLSRHAAKRQLGAMLLVRIVILSVTITRLSVAFAMIASAVSWLEATLYVAAPTLGTAVSIVPAGLGVSEAIAAGLAALVAGSSASAFLAVALNRGLGLVAGALLVFILPLFPGKNER